MEPQLKQSVLVPTNSNVVRGRFSDYAENEKSQSQPRAQTTDNDNGKGQSGLDPLIPETDNTTNILSNNSAINPFHGRGSCGGGVSGHGRGLVRQEFGIARETSGDSMGSHSAKSLASKSAYSRSVCGDSQGFQTPSYWIRKERKRSRKP